MVMQRTAKHHGDDRTEIHSAGKPSLFHNSPVIGCDGHAIKVTFHRGWVKLREGQSGIEPVTAVLFKAGEPVTRAEQACENTDVSKG